MLLLEGVSKAYGARTVVRDVDLQVPRGTRVALIGASGSGKSTLLRMIVGLVTPDRGRVRIDGTSMTPDGARAARERIGWMPQDGGLFPHLSALANVTLVARLRGRDAAVTARRVAELAELARLSHATLARFPHELSGGERQRVALVRALVLDPDLLLLDEPLGALDPHVRARLQDDLLAAFRAVRKSVLLVTHDLAEAAMLAESVVVLHEGGVVQRGTMRELAHAPAHAVVAELVASHRSLAEAIA